MASGARNRARPLARWRAMRIATARRRPRVPELPGISAPARVDRRTKSLTKRIRPGEIAVIDHVDLDRVSAEALVSCRVAAVVNAAPSTSGRYPNLGPEIVLGAGIPLLDSCGPSIMTDVSDGDLLRIHEGAVFLDGRQIATGTVQTPETV